MHTKYLSRMVLAATLAAPAMAMVPMSAHAELSGNIGVVSKYILRGIGNENSGAALQGGIDYSHESGFYAGWWGSSLDYTYDASGNDPYTTNGFENDFYAGFSGEASGLSYNIGLIQYYYVNVDDSDLTELVLGVGYGPFSLQAQYLLTDGVWGNSGDIYWTANYETALPYDFTFGASLGYYTYDDDDAGNDERGWGETTKSSNFRHLNLTLSHPIGDTGADMSVTYIIAGKDREDNDYDNTMVFGISYAFDI
jgi:uncharacterized protein (TIGR02001 family)